MEKIKTIYRSIKPCQQVCCIIPLVFVQCNISEPIFLGGKTVFYGSIHSNELICPACRSRNVIQFGTKARRFKTLPVGRKKVELTVYIPRLCCKDCGTIRQPGLSFADPKKHYTHSLEQFVIDMCRVATIQDVAELTGLSWDTVKEIDKSWLHRKYRYISLKKLRYIAIDEVYLGRKRKYITIVMDLETGRVIHIGKGKGKDALKSFWKRLKRAKAKIRAIATDMASGYMAAVLEHLPKADLVLDHFHLVKWFNDKLSLLRRQLYREADILGKEVLKSSRYLLLKAPENLKSNPDKTKDEHARLQAALEFNKPLATAYYMKERLRLLFSCEDMKQATKELYAWIVEAQSSKIKILMDAAKKLQIWKPFILNWYEHRISTGKIEVMNRKIGMLQRQACGYRDEEYLKLRILHLHKSTYALTG
jgi:transposase